MSNKNLYWVGPRLSDIQGTENLFDGAIVFFGNESKSNITIYSLEEKENIRINHNNFTNSILIKNFLIKTIKDILIKNKDAYFMFYCDIYVDVEEYIQEKILCNNKVILNLLSDKFKMRNIFYPDIKSLNSQIAFTKEITYESLKVKYNTNSFIVQQIRGSGGNSTFFINSKEDNYLLNTIEDHECLTSEYIDNAIPVNVHVLISDNNTIIFPPSIQIVEHKEKKLLYSGADFCSVDIVLQKKLKNIIYNNCKIIASKLNILNYKGILGIDFLVTKDDVYFVEINPRFQASTFILNQALIENSLPSIQFLQYEVFKGNKIEFEIDYNSKINKSFFSILYDNKNTNEKFYNESHFDAVTPDKRNSKFNSSKLNMQVINNNIKNHYTIQKNSNFAYVIFDTPIIYKTLSGSIEVVNFLKRLVKTKVDKFINIKSNDVDKIALLKFELLTYGAQLTSETKETLYGNRDFLTIRDGIAGGIEILMFKNIHINVPIKEKFSYISPYKIEYNSNKNKYYLNCEGEFITDIDILPLPSFVNKLSSNNVKFEEVGQLFTDRLGISPFIGCSYNGKSACKFCEIGNYDNIRVNSLSDIEELLKECINNVEMKHILISGGTPFDNNFEYLIDVLKLIRKHTNLKIYQMIEPVSNEFIKKLYNTGLNEIAFNIEIFDRKLAKDIMPKKSNKTLNDYINALTYATTFWGKTGKVRSILIVGLESIESTLKGVEVLLKLGVMPILSAFRPVPNTPLENYSAPSSEFLFEVWKKSQNLAEKYNMTLGPFCIACQNNTISLPINNKYKYY